SAVSVHRGSFESRTACLDPQNTARRANIPGKDGGRSKKVRAWNSGPQPEAHAEQLPVCPSAQGGWIRQTGWVFAVRRGLLNGFSCGDTLAGRLSTAQGVVGRWCEP